MINHLNSLYFYNDFPKTLANVIFSEKIDHVYHSQFMATGKTKNQNLKSY